MTVDANKDLRRGQNYVEMLAGIVADVSHAVVLLDGGGTVVAANPAFRRLFFACGEAAGQSIYELADGALGGGSVRQFIDGLSADGGTGETSLELVQPRPLHVVMRGRSVAVPDAGRFVVLNISLRTTGRLSKRQAEIRELAHEIRTPLTSVFGFTELLLSRDFDEKERREFLELIYDEAGRLSARIEELLHIELDPTGESR